MYSGRFIELQISVLDWIRRIMWHWRLE